MRKYPNKNPNETGSPSKKDCPLKLGPAAGLDYVT